MRFGQHTRPPSWRKKNSSSLTKFQIIFACSVSSLLALVVYSTYVKSQPPTPDEILRITRGRCTVADCGHVAEAECDALVQLAKAGDIDGLSRVLDAHQFGRSDAMKNIMVKKQMDAVRHAIDDGESGVGGDVNEKGEKVTADPNHVLVLLWDNQGPTPMGWGTPGPLEPPNYGGFTVEKENCYDTCEWTTDRARLDEADIVLFDVCGYGANPNEWLVYPPQMPKKRPHQVFLWFALEQRNYFPILQHKTFMAQFDGKVHSDFDSLSQITFMCPWGDYHDWQRPPTPKTGLVAAMISNCGGPPPWQQEAKQRYEFLTELAKYIPIDSYGKCMHNKDNPEEEAGWTTSFGEMMARKIKLLEGYKFFLAFENSFVVDNYVTEKLAGSLLATTVPVYYGAPNIDQWAPSDHSVINVAAFESASDLADYLLALAADDEKYNEYHKWRSEPLAPKFQTLLDNCLFYLDCRLCDDFKRARALNPMIRRVPRYATLINGIDDHCLALNMHDDTTSEIDQFVRLEKAHALDLTDHFTISAWIKFNYPHGRIVDKNTAYSVDGYMLDLLPSQDIKLSDIKTGRLRFCGGDSCYTGNADMSPGTWNHVAVTYSTSLGGVLYVNGHEDIRFMPEYPVSTNDHRVHIGRAAIGSQLWRSTRGEDKFVGYVDEVTIWAQVLTADAVVSSMFSMPAGSEEGLVAYLGFDEGGGETVFDMSKNNAHGTIVGGARFYPSLAKTMNDMLKGANPDFLGVGF